jgi:hypothetical protein
MTNPWHPGRGRIERPDFSGVEIPLTPQSATTCAAKSGLPDFESRDGSNVARGIQFRGFPKGTFSFRLFLLLDPEMIRQDTGFGFVRI